MIGYNVIPYKDELLYSQIARYLHHSLGDNLYRNMLKLFGNGGQPACIDLPNQLEKVFDNYFFMSVESVDSMIQKYTLYPFYEPFLKNNKRERILKHMKLGGTSIVHNIAGINGSSLDRSRFPRYCSECARESIETFGETYWQRVHNIPGVIVCPKHNVFIRTFSPLVRQLNFSQFISPYELRAQELSVDKNLDNNLLAISTLLSRILEGKYSFDINLIDYHGLIQRTVYMRGKIIRYSQLMDDMINCYGANALRKYFPENSLLHWVPGLVRKPLTYFNPIKHILLNNFLLQAPAQIQYGLFNDPIWDGPWCCVNPICCSYRKADRTVVRIFFDPTLNRTAATVSCKCEMVYKCSFTLYKGERKKIITISEYGSSWKDHVILQTKAGNSALAISKGLNVSSGVILRFIKSRTTENDNDLKRQNELVKKRSEWKSLLESFEINKISNAIKANNSLYKWLFNHDHGWLKVTNRLYASRPQLIKLKLDWQTIDDQLLSKISEAVVVLKSQNFKGRITQNLISKIIKKEKNYLINHKSKIPNTATLLNDIVEPFEHYQVRRLAASISELKANQKQLTIAKIVRNSGLKSVTHPSVKEFLEDELNKLQSA
jgi:Tn7-like transposition protein D/TniQ